jgi:hypothetical protein
MGVAHVGVHGFEQGLNPEMWNDLLLFTLYNLYCPVWRSGQLLCKSYNISVEMWQVSNM